MQFNTLLTIIGIVQKVFSEKASAIARMRHKCVRKKCVQKCVKMGLVLWGKEERPKCVRNPSKLHQKCVKNPRNTFGGEHLLDDTEIIGCTPKGSYFPRGRSGHLLETPFSEPLLRALFYCKTHRKRPLAQNPSENPSQTQSPS